MSIVDANAAFRDPLRREVNNALLPSEEHSATVIVVPDIGAPHEAHFWSDGFTCWLATILSNVLINPCTLEFCYGLNTGDEFSWEQLLHCGDALVERLQTLATNTDLLKRPLIFICHGLGGIVVKRVGLANILTCAPCNTHHPATLTPKIKAIGVLYKQFYEPVFEKIIKVLCGIIFLGVPHPTLDKPEEWSKLALLLKATTRLSKKAVDKNGAQLSTIIRISRAFDESDTAVPILSVFEGKPTKVGTGFLSPKREHLVDESFAKTSARREKLIKVDTYHNDICNIDILGPFLPELKGFLESAMAFMPAISEVPTHRGPGSFAGWTRTASEVPDIDLSSGNYYTNRATIHSSENSNFEMGSLKEAIAPTVKNLNLPIQFYKPHVRNPDFRGRQDVLRQVKEALNPGPDRGSASGSSGLKTFAVCGVGGLGKTQLAVEYAYASRNDFDAIFILQASDSGKLAQTFAEISLELGLETEGSAGDQIVSKDIVLGWLSQPVRQIQEGAKPVEDSEQLDPTWLLIFDNADDLSVLRDFWPVAGNGSILVTSRDPLAKTRTHVSVTKGLDLNPLETQEAGSLLRDLTGMNNPDDVEPSVAIAKKLSGLPLAITQIAGTITRRDLSLDEFLELYEKESMRLDFHQSDEGSGAKTLYTVWQFEDLSLEASSLLNIISFLDPDQISEEILMKMSKLENSERLSGYPFDIGLFVKARTELSKSSLLKRNRDRRELVIHRIIQDVTRARMAPRLLEESYIAATNLLYLSWPFSEFEHSTARWKLCEPVLAHVANLLRLYETVESLRAVPGPRKKIARLFMDFGWYHFERGNIPESLPYFAGCEQVCQQAPDETQMSRGDNEGCLAQIASTVNDYENAIPHAKKSVEIFEIHAQGNFRLPQAYNELSEAYIAAGRWEEAIEQADLAIAGYKTLPYFCYPDWPMMNKGFSLCSLQRLDEASEVLESYLEHRERAFGPMDTRNFKTGQGLLFLGKVRGCQGRVAESLDLYLKALAQYHSTIGPKHYRVAALYYKLGTTYMSLDAPDEASVMYGKALEIWNDKVDYSAQIARASAKLSEANIALGLVDEAAENITNGKDHMRKLGNKYNRRIEVKDLDSLIPNWSD